MKKKVSVKILLFCAAYFLLLVPTVYGVTAYSPSGQFYGSHNAAYAPNGGTVGVYPEIGGCGSSERIESTVTIDKTNYVPFEPIVVKNDYLRVLSCLGGVEKVYTFATVIKTTSSPPDVTDLFAPLPNADYQYEMFPTMGPGVYTNRTNTLFAPATPGQYYIYIFVYGYYTTNVRYSVGFVRLPFTVGVAAVDSGLRIHRNGITYRIAGEPIGTLTSPLRIGKTGGGVQGIKLVDLNDPKATPFRVKTASGIKALMSYP